MTKATCDFCGKKTEVQRTHYGSGFGYVRLICAECQKELNAEIIKPEKKMTKKQMAEEILQRSSKIGVSETRFYKNVNKQPKGWIERCYKDVINAKTEVERKQNADYAMRFLQ